MRTKMQIDASPASRLFSLGLIGYLLADLAGMALIALGGTTLITGTPLLLVGIPRTFLGALASIICGFILVSWALARILVHGASYAQTRQPSRQIP